MASVVAARVEAMKGPWMGLGVLLVLALAPDMIGCATPAIDGPPEESQAYLELGTGSWRFEPVTDGDEISLVRGAQGGWHLWVSVRVGDFAGDRGILTLESQVADEHLPAQHSETVARLDPADSLGRRVFVGWPEVMAEPACLVDQMLRLRAVITDDDGHAIEDECYVMVRGGDDPPGSGCP